MSMFDDIPKLADELGHPLRLHINEDFITVKCLCGWTDSFHESLNIASVIHASATHKVPS